MRTTECPKKNKPLKHLNSISNILNFKVNFLQLVLVEQTAQLVVHPVEYRGQEMLKLCLMTPQGTLALGVKHKEQKLEILDSEETVLLVYFIAV